MTAILEPTTLGHQNNEGFQRLRKVKLGEVRASFSPKVYEHNNLLAFLVLAFDIALYSALITAVYLLDNPLAKVGVGIVAGIVTASLFVWAHDAAHGALFGFTRTAEVFGTIAMLPSLNMYRLWMYGHNKVHHGYTSYSPVDWIWRPQTPSEFAKASKWSRLVYRVERTLPGCMFHYLLRVWWPGMVTFRPDPAITKSNHFNRSRVFTAMFIAASSATAWVFGGGAWGVVGAVLVPFVVFTYVIALFVYLHHTHPTLPFFDDRKEWSATIGQVACSTIIRMSKPMEFLTHNIMVHTPHHVDMRIPFYRLPQAFSDMKQEYGSEILQYKWNWRDINRTFSTCKLYDFSTHTWYSYREAAALVANGTYDIDLVEPADS